LIKIAEYRKNTDAKHNQINEVFSDSVSLKIDEAKARIKALRQQLTTKGLK